MPCRTKNVRLWPLLAMAAVCWIAWVYSAQAPLTWRPTGHQYISLQRGCVAFWLWSPKERPALGLRDDLTITADREQPLAAQLPFAWCDGWGYGIGGPIWLPGAIVAVLALRIYLKRASRASPPVRRNRRRAALLMITALTTVTAFALAVAHRTEPLWGKERRLALENGTLVLSRADDTRASTGFLTTGTVVFTNGTATAGPPPFRQSALPFDLIPDFSTSGTGWRAAFPLWPIVLVLGWFAFRAVRAAGFYGPGRCNGCGYDRSGLAANAVCPECGTPAEGVTPTPTT
jgi:hypothetical protein